MTKVHITKQILNAINKIVEAGHGVELEMGEGGNSHSVTYITIFCRKEGEVAYTKKLIIKYTSSYQGRFFEFSGVSREFGELVYGNCSLDSLIEAATSLA